MPNREKVINGLEWILNDIEENGHYQVDNYEDEIREALVLLKEQEPRVLTLEEVQNDCPDYVYLEWQNCCVCCIKDGGESNKSVGYFAYGIEGYYYQFLWDTYGIRWRCWTAMPTDEQRKAVKWQ